ncbi:hypothetical protein Htur_4840 (plasmid) [Haloterrigena turkmenica DSM 5511]|uniref:Uncharacterized protein n=1 Tax=Haloterrigena turkmenica (strain ATCC 51198 / DSM 5511 / JCM 9101 / NCIMB 13204 / VKM B-1734 / 4k) TaxID=543526 RepID=D2S2K3_HALTV|nr:hypothetical protein [Haloterrigena turkmenica]ADB63600.1 hypothetical protein Htur_4840 [Haloterrigena turkmenica DSM 5511]
MSDIETEPELVGAVWDRVLLGADGSVSHRVTVSSGDTETRWECLEFNPARAWKHNHAYNLYDIGLYELVEDPRESDQDSK